VTGERAPLLIALALSVAAPQSAAAQERRPRLECSLERTRCFEGESVAYVVDALDVEDVEPPDLSGFADFGVVDRGVQSLNSTSVQIVNGQMRRSERFGTRFRYELTPRRSGRLVVPAPTASAGSLRLAGQDLELEVLSPDAQDFVRLQVEVEPAEVYPLRPVTVRLLVFVKRGHGAARGRDPVALLSQLDPPQPPMLRVPWVELAAGLRGQDWKEWLSSRLVRDRGGGFAINELQSQGLPSLLDEFFAGPRHALFDLQGRPAAAQDLAGLPQLAGRSDDYFVYRLEREIVPTRSGTLELGPATFQGRVVSALEGRRVRLEDVFALGRAARLVVKDVPAEGRPPAFTGGVGSFSLNASVAPTKARVGDPLTLTIAVTGEGNLEDILPPALDRLPEFTSAFKVYEPTAETEGGARLFTASLRPLSASVKEVPAVALAWFDPVREQYVTASTRPLPIEVEEATRLDADSIVSRGPGRRAEAPSLSAHAEGIFGHDTDPRGLGEERVNWKAHAAAAALLPILTLGSLSALSAWKRRHADPRARRRRAAPARARERAKLAAQLAARGEALAAAHTVRAALLGLVADAAQMNEAGLTARESAEALRRLGAGDGLAQAVGAALDRFESLRFAGGGGDGAALAREGTELIERVLDELASKRCFA
jgi:hypothetical protein